MKDGNPAFPCNSPDGMESYKGMSLRDYFAGQALAGMAVNLQEHIKDEKYAEWAYGLADAMLAEGEKENA